MDIHELANAWTMVPFFYFTWHAKTTAQSIAITLMWMSSIKYHLHNALHQHAEGNFWRRMDCTFQIASLLVLLLEAPCYATAHVTRQATSMAMTSLLGFLWGSVDHHDSVLATTLLAHAVHLAMCVAHAPHRADLHAALRTLLPFPLVVFDTAHRPQWWSVGHVILFWYTYFSWRAVGMLRDPATT